MNSRQKRRNVQEGKPMDKPRPEEHVLELASDQWQYVQDAIEYFINHDSGMDTDAQNQILAQFGLAPICPVCGRVQMEMGKEHKMEVLHVHGPAPHFNRIFELKD